MKPVLLTLLLCFSSQHTLVAQTFTKIEGVPVVSDARYSEGSAWGDINSDGYLDVFVPDLYNTQRSTLFINNGNGTFTEVTTGPVVTDASRSAGGSFGDFNNDTHLDLFVGNFFGDDNALYLNNGDGTFRRITTGDLVNDGGESFGTSVADYDNDGFLDIFVSNLGTTDDGEPNFLYRNDGDATFTKITTGDAVKDVGASASSSWGDYDNDGDVDLFVPNGGTFAPVNAEHFFYQNNNDGTFTRLSTAAIGIENSWGGYGSWVDYDEDGDLDLFVTNFGGDDNMLYQNNGDGTFTRITEGILVNDGGDSVSSAWADFDNDGDLDVYVTNDFNENNVLYENAGDGTFTKITTGDLVRDGGRSNGATWADYDRDGFVDLFVPNGQRPASQSNQLYRNNGNGNHWINIKCVGTTSNTSAIGTKLRSKAQINGTSKWQHRHVSGSTGFNAQNSFDVEFGLGDATQIDSLMVEWPSGLIEVYANLEADRFYEVVEGEGFNPVFTSRQDASALPPSFEVRQNYPNPFTRSTSITYELSDPARVRIQVYNMLGKELLTLVDGLQGAGTQQVIWEGADEAGQAVASGVYMYRIVADNQVRVRKMLLLR